MINIYKSS